MKAHWSYLKYLLRHKWFVFLECCKLGIPWLGVIHDWSKFLPVEWFPYVHSFYNPDGSPRKVRDETGYYDPGSISAQFDLAWLHHQHWNRHHWQHWILVQDEDADKVLPIPNCYQREMLADWRGAGRAQGTPDTSEWYHTHKRKMKLDLTTRVWLGCQLGAFFDE